MKSRPHRAGSSVAFVRSLYHEVPASSKSGKMRACETSMKPGGMAALEQGASSADYVFRELCHEVLSPGAVGVLEQLTDEILNIYNLDAVLDRRLPLTDRDQHAEKLVTRLRRVTRLLPADISPMPNEVFTAIEFLVYEIDQRPIHIGEAITRLELLADEMRARPMVHSLVTGRAN